jgi:hypothetical protein
LANQLLIDENAWYHVSYSPKPTGSAVITDETTLIMPKTQFRLKLYNVGCYKSNYNYLEETKICGTETSTPYNLNKVYQYVTFWFNARIFNCEGIITVDPNQEAIFTFSKELSSTSQLVISDVKAFFRIN